MVSNFSPQVYFWWLRVNKFYTLRGFRFDSLGIFPVGDHSRAGPCFFGAKVPMNLQIYFSSKSLWVHVGSKT